MLDTRAIDTVGTTGTFEIKPGAVNSVPRHAKLAIGERGWRAQAGELACVRIFLLHWQLARMRVLCAWHSAWRRSACKRGRDGAGRRDVVTVGAACSALDARAELDPVLVCVCRGGCTCHMTWNATPNAMPADIRDIDGPRRDHVVASVIASAEAIAKKRKVRTGARPCPLLTARPCLPVAPAGHVIIPATLSYSHPCTGSSCP